MKNTIDMVSYLRLGFCSNADSIAARLCCPSLMSIFAFIGTINVPNFLSILSSPDGMNSTALSIDAVSEDKRKKLIKVIKPDLLVSAEKGEGIPELKDMIFEKLNLMRLFMKEVGKNPDLDEPMIVRKGITIEGVCNKIHRDFVKKFKFAKIWGKSAKFPGQVFHRLDKKLEDGDIIEIHIS